MARITVEDCLKNVDNRFELVIVASKRARDIELGNKDPQVAWENDKPTVVALREIAAGHITRTYLDEKDNRAAADEDEDEGGSSTGQFEGIDFSIPV